MLKKNFTMIVIVIIAIFLGVGFLISRVGSQYSGPPLLKVSEEVGDLGQLKPDQPQSYLFTLKNEGGEALIIERVQAPCGCTATILKQDKILPGETTQLEVTFNPRGYEGEVTQSVYIYSNDPETPRKRIVIRANVERIPSPKIEISTTLWDLGLLSIGDFSSLSVTVTNQGDLALDIENIVLPTYVHYQREILEFPKQLAPEEKIELNFIYDSSGHEIGVVREYIRLVTNDPSRRNVTIRIEGYLKEKEETILISPIQNFILTKGIETEIYEANFLIKNNSNKELKEISIASSQEYIEVSSDEISLSPGEEKKILLRIEKQSVASSAHQDIIQEYIYVRVAIPVDIHLELP